MASVTELVNLICQNAGIDATSNTEDRIAALSRLNHAYKTIILKMGGLQARSTVSPAAADEYYTATGLDTQFIGIDYVRILYADTGNISAPLPRINNKDIVTGWTNTQGDPTSYSYVHPRIVFSNPHDGVNDLVIDYRCGPATLVEVEQFAGEEDSPSGIPAMWHENLLAALATVLILEGYEGREQDAAYHRNLFNEAMFEYRAHAMRMGGEGLPRSPDNASGYNTRYPLWSRGRR